MNGTGNLPVTQIIRHSLLGVFFLILLIVPNTAVRAQSILRDAEMELFFHQISDPLFEAAELTPKNVHMYLIGDKSLNAFVTGGQNIFIHAGLFLEADHVGQLIGVIAHETCHIACAHRIAGRDAAAAAGNYSILSMVLGAVAIAAGAGDAGLGLILGGQTTSQFQYLAYNRGQESEADIAGARYLEATGQSGRGLIEFFEKLRDQEVLALRRQDPYVRSHPLNRTRIQRLENVVSSSPYYNTAPDDAINKQFRRLQAKLYGFVHKPRATLAKYPTSDTSVEARYARVYAYHKALEWDLAIAEADELIKLEPFNPYFHEIKGQILFENHKVDEALESFEQAIRFAPTEPLLKTAYGQAILSKDDKSLIPSAIYILEEATRNDPYNTFAWYNLARAYGSLGNNAMANLATAERFFAARRLPQAYHHAKRAQPDLKIGSPQWIRAQDIMAASESAAFQSEERPRLPRQRVDESLTPDS